MLEGQQAVQRRVDGRRARVQVEERVVGQGHHLVLHLETLVHLLHVVQLLDVQSGDALARERTDVPAGALDPENLLLLTRERVPLHRFAGGVAAAVVGDA